LHSQKKLIDKLFFYLKPILYICSINKLKQKDMGFFSWKTCDTGESIANVYSGKPIYTVHMITPDGRVFTENEYDGYGVFGGKDFCELLAELNGLGSDRSAGIDICFKNNPNGDNTPGVIYPKLVENLESDVVAQYNSLPNPETCEAQGYFYGDDEEEDEDEDWDDEDEEEDEEE
jgi:hypothetical protein